MGSEVRFVALARTFWIWVQRCLQSVESGVSVRATHLCDPMVATEGLTMLPLILTVKMVEVVIRIELLVEIAEKLAGARVVVIGEDKQVSRRGCPCPHGALHGHGPLRHSEVDGALHLVAVPCRHRLDAVGLLGDNLADLADGGLVVAAPVAAEGDQAVAHCVNPQRRVGDLVRVVHQTHSPSHPCSSPPLPRASGGALRLQFSNGRLCAYTFFLKSCTF